MTQVQLDVQGREPLSLAVDPELHADLLAFLLDVVDWHPPARCWGYVNCCNCNDCLEREHRVQQGAAVPSPPVQPWEPSNSEKSGMTLIYFPCRPGPSISIGLPNPADPCRCDHPIVEHDGCVRCGRFPAT